MIKILKSSEKLLSYAVALLLAILITLIKLDFEQLGTATPFLMYIFVVIVAAYIGGFGTGLFALFTTSFFAAYYFLDPIYSYQVDDGLSQFRLIAYFLEGFVSVLILGTLRTVQRQLADANKTLEYRVKNRTEELRLAMSELTILNEKLTRSNHELEDFAYVSSHDLQEPLRKIQSFGNLLREEYQEKLKGDGQMYLERILSSTKRMRQLIDDLLSYSRVTSKETEFQNLSLNKLMKNLIFELDIQVEEAGAEIKIDDLPEILGDATQMYQVFQNLLSNALRYRDASRTLKIHMYADTNEHFHTLYVKDNGIGFEEKYKERIFNIFERLHGREQYKGTGVGLAIVKKVIHRHRGKIDVKSQPGVGTTFIITLPKFAKEKLNHE